MKRSTFQLFALCLAFMILNLFIAPDLYGHGGRFKLPKVKVDPDDPNQQVKETRGLSFPGGGPQVIFSEARWEFWWDHNADDIIGLKAELNKLAPRGGGGAVVDFPYERVTTKDRQEKLVLFLYDLIRKETNAEIREAAVISLARTRDPNIIPYIELTYESDDVLYVRTMAVIALGITKNQAAAPILESIFRNKESTEEIKFYAAVAMGMLGGDGAAKAFKKWLAPKAFKKLDRQTQQAVAFGVGLTNDSTLSPLIRSALNDRVTEDRLTLAYLIQSLGRLGDRTSNALIIKYLSNKSVQVRRSATIALGAAASPSDKDVVEALINKIRTDADHMVRNFAYISLGRIGGDVADGFLMKNLEQTPKGNLPFVCLGIGLSGNRANGEKLLNLFVKTADISNRSAMALAMGMLKHAKAVTELRKAVDSGSDPIYRGYCALALGMLKDGESVKRLKELYETQNDVETHRFAAMALGLVGDRSIVKKMYEFLEKSPSLLRLSTAYNLGLIGDRNAIDPLKKLAMNEKETDQLRKYAVLGLGLLADQNLLPAVSGITLNNNYTIVDNYLYELFNVN